MSFLGLFCNLSLGKFDERFTLMETITLHSDIQTLTVKAAVFPEGIKAAFDVLHGIFPSESRRFFGISYQGNDGKIIYMAAAEVLSPPEIDETGLDTFTIRKGNYICEKINNWKEDESRVKNIFEKLLAQPGIDPNGYCVEEYLDDKDMIAMVTLK